MKKKFDWEKFLNRDNRIVVNCKTEEEAELFCNLMHEHGLKWHEGELYTKKTNWSHCKNGTCYDSSGGFSDKEWFEENGYEVIEFGDYDFTGEPEEIILNANFYKDEIDKLNIAFKVTRTTREIRPCGNCYDCIFLDADEPCTKLIVEWLLSPYEPPKKNPVITDVVRRFLELCDPELYIVRDENGDLWVYEKRPLKASDAWWAEAESMWIKEVMNKNLYHGFDFVKWENDEPWKVADLLQIAAEQ